MYNYYLVLTAITQIYKIRKVLRIVKTGAADNVKITILIAIGFVHNNKCYVFSDSVIALA